MVEIVQTLTEPPIQQRFKPLKAKETISAVLRSKLLGAAYNPDNCSAWAKEIADEVKAKLKERTARYKYVVQVFIGEQKGAGVRLASRCLWDDSTDAYAHETFTNDSLFCVVVAYGLYLY